jgi:peptidoglycan/LPS O-acetylase OafA/YrhL
MWVAEPETMRAAVELVNAILPYAMAGAFFFWLIAEDREGSSRSRVLGLVSAMILALLFAGEDRDYHWWISRFVLVWLAALGIALAVALLGPLIPGPPP